ncbi:hypothetical protein [Hydrogenophaga sp.]|uniref:hypothetical protein n=1 Tax=Hydrogenophaga sp. TaxID=1904254 RepID=UPI003D149B7F
MSNPSLWPLCAAHFATHPDWAVPDTGPFAGPNDDPDLLVFRAQGNDHVFLSPMPEGQGVRLFRCVNQDSLDPDQDLTWEEPALGASSDTGGPGWVWWQDERDLIGPSALLHTGSGAIGLVLDLLPDEVQASPQAVQERITAWIEQGDGLLQGLNRADPLPDPALN